MPITHDEVTGLSYYQKMQEKIHEKVNSGSNVFFPDKVSNTEKFDEQIKTVTQERGKDYGTPSQNFSNMYLAERMIADCPNPAIQVALRMIMYKVCRLVNNPLHLDSVVDIAGYARCIAMIQDECTPQSPFSGTPNTSDKKVKYEDIYDRHPES